MTTTLSFYDILEIHKGASDAEIKKAYRALSLRYHPDRPGGDSEKFKQISEAYEILSDPHKKDDYDNFGPGTGSSATPFEMNADEINNINNIFSQIFGEGGIRRMGGGSGPGIRIHHFRGGEPAADFFGGGNMPGFFNQFICPPTIQLQIVVSLQQAFTGCVLPIKYEKTVVRNDKRHSQLVESCVEIPEGIADNEVVILERCGNEVNGVLGDVRALIHVQNSTDFSRQNLDLIYNKTISLKEALCGFSFDIPLITGKSLTIKNINTVKVIRPGFKQVCHGHGMRRDGKSGNLIIEFDIVFPESLSATQKEQIGAILP